MCAILTFTFLLALSAITPTSSNDEWQRWVDEQPLVPDNSSTPTAAFEIRFEYPLLLLFLPHSTPYSAGVRSEPNNPILCICPLRSP